MRRTLLGLFLATSAIGAANAQSYNCNRARTPDEVLICQSDELGRLDIVMADFYFELRNAAYPWRRVKMEQEQASWLHWRMSCGRDFQCIRYAYERRMQELLDQQEAACKTPATVSEAFCNAALVTDTP